MANQFLKLRRSAVPGKIPDTGSLAFGEIALNTYDGLAFLKKSGSNGEEIVTIGANTINVTGSQFYIPVFTGTSSFASSSIYNSGSVIIITGSVTISGSLFVPLTQQNNSLSGSVVAINTSTGLFQYTNKISSASLADTASSADNFTVRGTLTAQTIVAQIITSSTEFITGSTRFGSSLSDTHRFTGSVSISGSLSVNNSNVILVNQTSSMSVATASYVLNAVSASFSSTSSYINNLNQAVVISGSLSISGSSSTTLFSSNADTLIITGSAIVTGSVIVTGSISVFGSITGSLFGTSSWAQNALTASYVVASSVVGLSLFQIATGSVTASVGLGNDLFLIKSGSKTYFNISSSGDATLYSSNFMVRDFTTNELVFQISGSKAYFDFDGITIATQSVAPTGSANVGGILFTSTAMYIGLE